MLGGSMSGATNGAMPPGGAFGAFGASGVPTPNPSFGGVPVQEPTHTLATSGGKKTAVIVAAAVFAVGLGATAFVVSRAEGTNGGSGVDPQGTHVEGPSKPEPVAPSPPSTAPEATPSADVPAPPPVVSAEPASGPSATVPAPSSGPPNPAGPKPPLPPRPPPKPKKDFGY